LHTAKEIIEGAASTLEYKISDEAGLKLMVKNDF
jgi:hypothetical protein